MRNAFCLMSVACCLMSMGYAQDTIAFETGGLTGNVYSSDLSHPSQPAQVLLNDAGGSPCGIRSTADGNTIYFTDFNLSEIYTFPAAGPYNKVALGTGITNPEGIALSSDGTVGYVVTEIAGPAGVYSFPIGGSFPHTATLMTPTGAVIAAPLSITISGDTAYVSEFGGGHSVYTFPVNSTTTYDATIIQPAFSTNGLSVSNDGYLYMSSSSTGRVYRVPTSAPTGSPEILTGFIAGDLNGLTVSTDSKTVYVTSTANGIFAFPTNQGFPQTPVLISMILGARDITIPFSAQIDTGGLTGNNLRFANYLNENAPNETRQLFSSFEGSELKNALESASPARNAIPTFISDWALFIVHQLLSNNLAIDRMENYQEPEVLSVKQSARNSEVLTASANVNLAATKPRIQLQRPPTPVDKSACWVEFFGGLAYQKSQKQNAAFSVDTGGAMAALEHRWSKFLFGGGLSYIYNYSPQEQHRGNSKTNQGVGVVYAEWILPNFYTNLFLSGAYSHVNKQRHIKFPGYNATASSSHNIWQLMPHIEIGGEVRWSYFTLEPFVIADWVSSWKGKYTEHGAPRLNTRHYRQRGSYLRNEVGFRFYEKISYSWGNLSFIEKLSYARRQPFHTGSTVSNLVGSPGKFRQYTLVGTQSTGIGQLEVIYCPIKESLPKCTLGYQGEFSTGFQAHQIFLTIKMVF